MTRPVLTFAYHDPRRQREAALQHELPALRAAFSGICVSAIPPLHEEYLQGLESQGCAVYRNAPGTSVGDHARAALRLSLEQAPPGEPIFYGFDDRVLYALASPWREAFLHDMGAAPDAGAVVYERTPAAWATHPDNYREIEGMVSRALQLLCGRRIELGISALMLSVPAARTALAQSVTPGFEVWGEWVLLALKERIPVATRAVDWLAWEDPYWAGVPLEQLKHEREQSREETLRRIRMNAPCLALLAEERFGGLCPP